MGPAQSKRHKISEEDNKRLAQGKAIHFQGGVSIKLNPVTGKFEGVPEQWVKNYDLPIPVDQSKMIKTRHFYKQIRPQENLPDTILQLINAQPQAIKVSKPIKFQHVMHLEVDLNSEYGIKGLPEEWKQKFKKYNIQSNQVKQNPQEMLKILKGIQAEPIQPPNTLLSNQQFQSKVKSIVFRTDNPSDEYRFAGQLGKGAMCKVYHAYHRKNASKQYAVRVMKIQQQETLQKIKIETAVMTMCYNKNIIQYFTSFYYKKCLFMLIQYMDGGALTDMIYQYIKKIPQNVSAFILREIMLGLQPLHQHKQIHRDLKSDNILVNKKGEIKVADFGFAIQLTKEKKNRKTVVGTPAWMAPQLIKKQYYNELVDVWSVGVIGIQLADGEPPYLRLPALKAMYMISTKQPYRLNSAKFSPDFCNFIQVCLAKDPKQRWSIKKLLNHPFIKKIGTGQKERGIFIDMIQKKKKQMLQFLQK